MVAISRWVHLATACLFVVGVLVQGYLAGAALDQLGGSGDFSSHAAVGYTVMGVLALAVVLFALLGRLPRGQVALSALLLILYIVQSSLPAARESSPAIAALHPANAMVLLVLAIVIAMRAPRHVAS
jgi:hypothetical protein